MCLGIDLFLLGLYLFCPGTVLFVLGNVCVDGVIVVVVVVIIVSVAFVECYCCFRAALSKPCAVLIVFLHIHTCIYTFFPFYFYFLSSLIIIIIRGRFYIHYKN